jgi:hypothetical protein
MISQARGRAHVGGSATAVDRSSGTLQGGPKKEETGQATTCARRGRQRHLQEEETQPGTKAGITSGERGGAVANSGVPPWLEGRGIHRGVGKHVLTLMATGCSAGVGEERRSVLVGVEGDDGAV